MLLSTIPRFAAGSASHWTVLFLGALFLGLTVFCHRRNAESRPSRITRGIIIFACLTAAVNTSGSRFFMGQTGKLDGLIPLHLCDLTAFVAAFALLFRKPVLCEVAYYCGLGGTLQGLLTPNLQEAFPHPNFFAFFQLHYFVVAAALLLPLGLGWRPRRPLWKTIFRTFLIIDGYLLSIYLINLALGTNYAFMMHKPDNASLFDHLGPYPWYLLSVQGLTFAMLLLLTLPFVAGRKRSDHEPEATS